MAGRTVSLFLVARDRMSKTFRKAAGETKVLETRLKSLQKISAGVSAISGLTQAVTALGAATVPVAASIAALPGILLTTKAATATLTIGLHGVGDAMDAIANNDSEKLEKALSKMTPAAKAFVEEAAKFNAALSPIRTAVQEKLFEGLASTLSEVAKAQLPGMTKGMVGVAGAYNLIAKEAAEWGKSAHAQGVVNKIFGTTESILTKVGKATQPILRGISDLAVAGLPFTEQLTDWVINGTKAASAFFSSEKGAAALKNMLNGAKEAFSSLGLIVKNLGSILTGVFKNSGMSGTGVLKTLEQLTAQAAAWVNSAEGQEKIADIFALLNKVVSELGPALLVLVSPLGLIGQLLISIDGPAQDVVAKVIAFGLAAALLGSKLGFLVKILAVVTGGLWKFVAGIIKGKAGLDAKAGAAARAGAAVRGFAVAIATGTATAWKWTTSLLAAAAAKTKVAVQAGIAATRTAALTVAQKASAVAAKAMAAATWLVNAAMRANPIGIIITIIMALVGAIVLAYNKSETFRNIVNAAWAGIKNAISTAWNNVIKPALQALWSFIVNTLAPKFLWFHNNIVKPVFSAIGAIIKWAWNNLIKPAFAAIVFYFKNILGPVVKWLYNNIVKPVWNAIGSAIKTVWNKLVKPAFDGIKSGVKKVGDSFKTAADFIKKAWKKIEGYAKAPIKFVVNTVLNNGILKAWNFVASKFKLKPDDLHVSLPKGFAKGGILPGYSRTDDQVIAARSGEGILVPEAVKSLGERFIHRANSLKGNAAKLLGVAGDPGGLGIPGFQEGGIVGGLKAFFGKAKDWFMDGVKNAAKLVTGPILSGLEAGMGDSPFAKMLAGIPRRMVSGFLSWIDGKEDAISGAGGGAGGKAVAAARKQIGLPYSWGGGGPGGPSYGIGRGAGTYGFDCSGLTEYAWYQATKRSIGGTTYSQKGILKRVGAPRPGDVGQPHPGHTYLMSSPGKIIEAPYTGAHVREVPMRNTPWWGRPPWVMDTGGVLQPGMNPPIYNGTGGPEYVLRPDQLERTIRVVIDVVGAEGEFKRLIRKMVRVDGRGNVQMAFGNGSG